MRRRHRPAPLDAVARHPLRGAVVAGAFLAGALLLWLGFAPTSVGGNFSYVMVQGDSMAPAVNHGDIVLLRSRDDYDPGDIVAYHHPQLGVVLHRIVADRGGRFVVQGDNRNNADAFQPTPGDVIGAGFQTLPRVGVAIDELQSPRNLALLVAGAVGLGVVTRPNDGSPRGPRRRRPARGARPQPPRESASTPPPRRGGQIPSLASDGVQLPPRSRAQAPPAGQAPARPAPAAPEPRTPRARPSARRAPRAEPFLRSLEPAQGDGNPPRGPGGLDLGRFSFYGPWGGQILAVLIAVMLIAIALPIVIGAQGTTELTSSAVAYGVEGSFRYGPEANGRLFEGTRNAPPEPVFRALTSELPIVYEFATASESAFEPENVTGAYELVAEVRHANGWRQPLVIQPTTLFAGSHVALNGTLDLNAIDRVIADFEEATGITSDIYELALVATVAIEGELAGQPFSRRIIHPMGFRLTTLQLQFDDRVGDLEFLDGGTVSILTATSRTMTLPVLGTEIAYTDFPRIAVAVLILCGFGLAVLGLITYQTFRAGERARIHSRYDDLLIEVASDRIPATDRVLRVARFGDLVRIAEREGLPILAAGPPIAGRRRPEVEAGAPYPNSPLRHDPRALIEAFLAGDDEALEIVEGAESNLEPAEIVDTVVDLSGQYFVIDGDLTYRYVADEFLPGSRFERLDADYYDEAA